MAQLSQTSASKNCKPHFSSMSQKSKIVFDFSRSLSSFTPKFNFIDKRKELIKYIQLNSLNLMNCIDSMFNCHDSTLHWVCWKSPFLEKWNAHVVNLFKYVKKWSINGNVSPMNKFTSVRNYSIYKVREN